jgi:hypothetical protein
MVGDTAEAELQAFIANTLAKDSRVSRAMARAFERLGESSLSPAGADGFKAVLYLLGELHGAVKVLEHELGPES